MRSSLRSLSNPPKLYVVVIRGPRMRVWRQSSHPPRSRSDALRTAEIFRQHGAEAKVLPVVYFIDTSALQGGVR